ncbi:hypothetical protein MKW98_014191, partial [Papaver atlanticum]
SALVWLKNIMRKESSKDFYGAWHWIFERDSEHMLLVRDRNKYGEYPSLTISADKSKHLTILPAEKGLNRWKRFMLDFDKCLSRKTPTEV